MNTPWDRRSLRLRRYDYSQNGAYFVTLCAQNRECVFGAVEDKKMISNDPGQMIMKWWSELMNKFPSIETNTFIVMPNHVHGVVVLHVGDVGAALRGRPTIMNDRIPRTGHPHRGAPTLGNVIDWFKTMTTNEYIRGVKQRGWPPFSQRLWQRNYYDRVIRNERELLETQKYIQENPLQWETDPENIFMEKVES